MPQFHSTNVHDIRGRVYVFGNEGRKGLWVMDGTGISSSMHFPTQRILLIAWAVQTLLLTYVIPVPWQASSKAFIDHHVYLLKTVRACWCGAGIGRLV